MKIVSEEGENPKIKEENSMGWYCLGWTLIGCTLWQVFALIASNNKAKGKNSWAAERSVVNAKVTTAVLAVLTVIVFVFHI